MNFVMALSLQKSADYLVRWFKEQIPSITSFCISLVIAIIVVFVGKRIVKILLSILKKNLIRIGVEEGVTKFILSLSKFALYTLLVIIVAQILGLETSSVIAILGSAGLAIGLALQGSLANFAGGILILVSKPFVMGDYIIVDKIEGTVVGIDIIYTRLLTIDNRKVVLPNGTLANSDIINATSEEKRRLDMNVSIDYNEDIDRVKKILTDLLTEHDYILMDEPIQVFVSSFDPSAINIGFRVWTLTEYYWNLKWELLEEIKTEFDKNEIVIPFDQLDVNIRNNGTDN